MADEIPSWLDGKFLESALQERNGQGSSVSVENFSVKPAVAAGNNYTSHLYRVFVEYKVAQSDKLETISLIVKMPMQKGVIQEMSDKMDLFSKEPKMYADLLPKMHKMSEVEFGPKSFYCPITNGLIVQDLKPNGYILHDRFSQLDFEHCKLVMEKLGKFHGTSVACYHQDPELIKAIGKDNIYNHGGSIEEEMKSWVISATKMFTNVLQENGHEQEHVDLISSRIDKVWDSMVNICQPKSNVLNVLNHGDCWSSNMLFKYSDDGNVIDIMFIDYQIMRYTSPVPDILYFIFTSANEEVRENRLEELYDIYLKTLNKTLEKLGCVERLTRKEFSEELKSASDFFLVTLSTVLPFTKCETEDAPNMESITTEEFASAEGNDKFNKIYNGERFKALLPALVRQYASFVSA